MLPGITASAQVDNSLPATVTMLIYKAPAPSSDNFTDASETYLSDVEIDPSFFGVCNYSVLHPDSAVLENGEPRPYTKTSPDETFYAKGFKTTKGNYTETTLKRPIALGGTGKTFIVYANMSTVNDWAEMVSYSSSYSDQASRHGLARDDKGKLFLNIGGSFQNDTGLKFRTGEPVLYCGVVESSEDIKLYQYSKTGGMEEGIGKGDPMSVTMQVARIGKTLFTSEDRYCAGSIYYSIMMDRAITKAEFTALSANVNQIFKPKPSILYYAGNVRVSAALKLPGITASAQVDYSLPVYNVSATVTLPGITVSGNADHSLPVYNVSALVTLPGITASAQVLLPVYNVSAPVTLPGITVSGNADYSLPVYTSSSILTLPGIVASATVDYTIPFYSVGATIELTAIQITGKVNFGSLINASLDLPAITAQASADYTLPVYELQATLILPGIEMIILYRTQTVGCTDIISFVEEPFIVII